MRLTIDTHGSKSESLSVAAVVPVWSIAASSSASSKLNVSGAFGTGRLSSCCTGLIAEDRFGYSIAFLFLLEKPETLVRQKITVCHVSTSEPSSKIDSTSSTANVRSPFLVLITSLATKIQLICFLNKSSHNASLRLNRELSTNITECIAAVEPLARYFRPSLNSR